MLTRQAEAAVCMLLAATASLSGQTEKVDIMLSGEVRVRSELDARTSAAGTNHATLLRTGIEGRRGSGSWRRCPNRF